MEILITNIDWIALIIGFVVSMPLGAFWYSKKGFGAGWMKGCNITEEEIEQGGMLAPLLTQSLAALGLSWVIAIAFALQVAPLSLLFILTLLLFIASNGFWNMKSMYAIFTETGFIITMSAIMILLQIIL